MKTKYILLFVFTIQLALSGMSQVTDDIEIVSSWIRGENNGGMQFGRTPADQQDTKYWVGSTIHNAGTNDQTNITLTADYGSFISGATIPFLAADSTVTIETLESLSLWVNLYSGNHVITSDADTIGGANFGNNTMLSEFEITNIWGYYEYSLDGIGVYSNPQISAIGTGYYIGGADGLVLATKYYLKQNTAICGIRVMLADSSIAGGDIYGSIKDSSTFWAGDMTSLEFAYPKTISNTDIANGYIDLYFPPTNNFSPGIYYAAVQLYSNGNTSDIHVLDDLTIPQPEDASGVYIPGDTTYAVGNALAIRLNFVPYCYWGLEENNSLGIAIFPNPSDGIVEIKSDDATTSNIIVYDMVGNIILTKEANGNSTIDLSSNETGIYMVKVSTANGSMVERVVIK